MARARLALGLLACCCLALAAAQDGEGEDPLEGLVPPMGGGGPGGMMGGGDPQKAKAVVSDLPFIRCAACEAFVKQAGRMVKALRAELKPGASLDEERIIDGLETMCDPGKPAGQWITHYDIVEAGDALRLVDKGLPSVCNSECATLARACAGVAEALDLIDLSEALYAGASRAALTQLACYDASAACRTKPPPVPKVRARARRAPRTCALRVPCARGCRAAPTPRAPRARQGRAPGPAHEPMSADEMTREALMAALKKSGLGGEMYKRDEVVEKLKGLQERADGGEFPEVALQEAGAGGDDAGAPAERAAEPAPVRVARPAPRDDGVLRDSVTGEPLTAEQLGQLNDLLLQAKATVTGAIDRVASWIPGGFALRDRLYAKAAQWVAALNAADEEHSHAAAGGARAVAGEL
ncbi:hypothetical protein HT031_003997 [Scenedesmus sp. PABB004]|nr:hypothetical protein HT031_003997 [Scenedesmus sp. PABB004]